MRYDLPQKAEEDIIKIAKRNGVRKVILFGSRARCDNTERSDIDLAVSGGDAEEFYAGLEDNAWTLLMFDVVNLDKKISDDLRKEIDRDGVVLYEEI